MHGFSVTKERLFDGGQESYWRDLWDAKPQPLNTRYHPTTRVSVTTTGGEEPTDMISIQH